MGALIYKGSGGCAGNTKKRRHGEEDKRLAIAPNAPLNWKNGFAPSVRAAYSVRSWQTARQAGKPHGLREAAGIEAPIACCGQAGNQRAG
jgi:hypothetical protein